LRLFLLKTIFIFKTGEPMLIRKIVPFFILVTLLAGCGSAPATSSSGLRVVASTTILGDVVAQVGDNLINLSVLFPIGADPHTFDPRPQDVAAISDAQVVFINGLGLEESLQPALDANAKGTVMAVSDGIDVRKLDSAAAAVEHGGNDPHTWTDPNNVIVWTQNIAAALAKADPANASVYRANADTYIASLRDLDAWIRTEVAQIPPERRKLVTDHYAFGYFADEYGFEQVGALVGSFSTNASPSAQEIAALEDTIRAQNVPAVFVGATLNATMAEQVAQDTGTKIVSVYTGSLTAPGGDADSYLAFMRYNVNAIVSALK
jgi:manganese/iron transport system substrate-binding protein